MSYLEKLLNNKNSKNNQYKLEDHGFILLEEVRHSEFNSFLLKHRWKYSKLHLSYNMLIFLFFMMTTIFFFMSRDSLIARLMFVAFGVLTAFLLVPLHEFIHLLTYKYLGATNVTIVPYIRYGYVLTLADQFIVGRQEMKWIALMPITIISGTGLAFLVVANDHWQIFVSAIILFHATLCLADFRILDYFLTNKSNIVMYNNIRDRVTYIYQRT